MTSKLEQLKNFTDVVADTGDIRSMSQGRAASTMELAHYEEVPPNVAQEIIEKRSK